MSGVPKQSCLKAEGMSHSQYYMKMIGCFLDSIIEKGDLGWTLPFVTVWVGGRFSYLGFNLIGREADQPWQTGMPE